MSPQSTPAWMGPLILIIVAGCSDAPHDPKDSTQATASRLESPFRDVAADVGLVFEHFIGASGEYFMPEVMGSGVALIDFDLDGDLDVFVVQGEMLDPDSTLEASIFDPPSDHWPGNRLFRNDLVPDGRLEFTDVTDGAGLGSKGYGMGVTVGDMDNDGDPDMYVTNHGSNVLYRNDGDGRFTDITAAAGVDDPRWTTAAGFHDYDRDGDLDLFVVNYVEFHVGRNTLCTSPGGRRDYCGPKVYPPTSDRLFRNDGDGRFTDVTESIGLGNAKGAGLGLVWADFDGDGWSDAFVANDGEANFLWRSETGISFEDVGLLSGTAYNMIGSPEASMGVTAGDFDADGDEDLFMTHLIQESNTLYVNDGNGFFVDATDRYQLGANSRSLTGFGSKWFDYDNDGFLDLFVANGNVKLEESRVGVSDYPFEQRNQLFRNNHGRGFVEVGLNDDELARLEVSRGAAFGDVDNDGDTDIVVTNNNGPMRLLLNEVSTDAHWLRIRLEGTESNRDGTGARVAVVVDGQPTLWRRSQTDGSYLSAHDSRVHFGLGATEGPVVVRVYWPRGSIEVWDGVELDREITLLEGQGTPINE